jgi:hypothetical protein
MSAGAAFNAVREAILGSAMKPEGEFLLAEITRQDVELEALRAELRTAEEARDKAEWERDGAKAIDRCNRLFTENYALRIEVQRLNLVLQERESFIGNYQHAAELERADHADEVQRLKQAAKYEADVATQAAAEVQRLSGQVEELEKTREKEYFFRFPKSLDHCGPYRSIEEMREDSAWKHRDWTPVWRYKGIAPGSYHEIDRDVSMGAPGEGQE